MWYFRYQMTFFQARFRRCLCFPSNVEYILWLTIGFISNHGGEICITLLCNHFILNTCNNKNTMPAFQTSEWQCQTYWTNLCQSHALITIISRNAPLANCKQWKVTFCIFIDYQTSNLTSTKVSGIPGTQISEIPKQPFLFYWTR